MTVAMIKKESAWLQNLLIHVPPVLSTLMVMRLYILGFRWKLQQDQINLLLVAAKIYEFLILFSLSSILLHRIRCTLKSSRGVPLGFLSSPFQLNSPFYLFSRQFWTAATRSPTEFNGDFTTKIWIVTIFVLAFAVGPSTGVLLIPKQAWWLHSQQLYNNTHINATWDSLHPTNVTVEAASSLCYTNMSSKSITAMDSARECPLRGLPQILASLPQVLSILDTENATDMVSNSTLSRGDYTKNIALGWKTSQLNRGMSTVAYSTSPLDIVSRDLQIRGNNIWQQKHTQIKVVSHETQYSDTSYPEAENSLLDVSTKKWHQPVVAVECVEAQQDIDANTASFSNEPFASTLTPLVIELNRTWLNNAPLGLSAFDQTSSLPVVVSVAFLYRSESLTALCLAAARWSQSELSVSKPFGTIPESNILVEPISISRDIFQHKIEIITISSVWLSLFHEDGAQETSSGAADIQAACEKDVPIRCLPITLSLYIVDALSRLQYHFPAYECHVDYADPSGPSGGISCRRLFESDEPSPDINVVLGDFESFTGITSEYYQWQYAYGLSRSNAAEAIALVVVCIHVFLVFLHIKEHLILKRTDVGHAWNDLGSLVAVVMKASGMLDSAQVPRQENTSANTWRLRIFLRREDGDGALNITVCQPGTRIQSAAPGNALGTANV